MAKSAPEKYQKQNKTNSRYCKFGTPKIGKSVPMQGKPNAMSRSNIQMQTLQIYNTHDVTDD